MANPFGTTTPSADSSLYISPSEALLPPTSATSSMLISEKGRTYLVDVVMTDPFDPGESEDDHSSRPNPRWPMLGMHVLCEGRLRKWRCGLGDGSHTIT